MSDAEVADILRLPPEERLRLAELIWESLAANPSSVPLGDAHRTALDQELADHRRDPNEVLTLHQVLAGVRKGQ